MEGSHPSRINLLKIKVYLTPPTTTKRGIEKQIHQTSNNKKAIRAIDQLGAGVVGKKKKRKEGYVARKMSRSNNGGKDNKRPRIPASVTKYTLLQTD